MKTIQNKSNGQALKGLVFEDATNREVQACNDLFGDVNQRCNKSNKRDLMSQFEMKDNT